MREQVKKNDYFTHQTVYKIDKAAHVQVTGCMPGLHTGASHLFDTIRQCNWGRPSI